MDRKRRRARRRKKKQRLTVRPTTDASYFLRCASLGLTDAMLDLLPVGAVYDMLTEQANDQYEWPIKATQEDIDRFF